MQGGTCPALVRTGLWKWGRHIQHAFSWQSMHLCGHKATQLSTGCLDDRPRPELPAVQAIDKRLKKPVAAMGSDLSLPPDIAQARQESGGSAQQYGQQRQAVDNQVRRWPCY